MQQPADFTGKCLGVTDINPPQPPGQLEFGFEFGLRTQRNGEVIQKHLPRAAVVTFRDVRWNGYRRAANLLGQAKAILDWQIRRNAITGLCQLHRALPRYEIAIGADLRLIHEAPDASFLADRT